MTHAPNHVSPRGPARRRALAFWCLMLVFAPLVLLAPAGCGGGGGGSDTGATTGNNSGRVEPQPGWNVLALTPVQTPRKWTILLYMNGANDLEEFGSLNLNQLETVGSNGDINIVAQFKRMRSSQSYDDKSNGDWTGTRRYLVTKDNDQATVTSTQLSNRADLDMGQAASLRAFIDWGVATFPAEKYCIVLWNHGAGWRSRARDKSVVTRGFSYDDETENHIDTNQLPAAIQLSDGRKWDLITWDSSLMQMAEVAYEIRNQGKWIVGSEESPPGAGYPYDRFISQLAANPNMDGRAFGTIIADETLADYGPNSNITQSLLDASKIEPLAAAANALGAALMNAKATYGEQIALARDDAEFYDYRNNKDLLDFLRLLKANVPDGSVQTAATQLEAAARAAIVKSVNGRDHPNSNGLAVYLPTPNGYRRDDIEQANGFGQRYVEIAFAQAAPNWQSFLAQGPP